jgi:hypothetical protein
VRIPSILRSTICAALVLSSAAVRAQDQAPADQPMDATQNTPSSNWMFMYDGALFATFNRQTGNRGDTQFRSQNWLMLMASRPAGRAQLTLSGMFSAEPATVTSQGYAHLFQMGEAYKGLENTDRQHPHDLFTQLAVTLRVPVGSRAGVTFAAAPVGEATLGPVAFMHRASSHDIPSSPLAHHTLDSTHISDGVLAVSMDVHPWIFEASAFRGREPDEKRWDIKPGRLDSGAARIWFRPSNEWIAQVSYGKITQPERLIAGDVYRTTASLSWTRGFLALTEMYGHNKRTYSDTSASVTELTARLGKQSVYGRFEWLQIETEHLLFPLTIHKPHVGERIDWLQALTLGGIHDFWTAGGHATVGVGGDIGTYGVPYFLQQQYGVHPLSFHVFLRVRPPADHMGSMVNTTMMQPLAGHSMN